MYGDNDEVIAFVEGTLDPTRLSAWTEHARQCQVCTELSEDLHTYQRLTSNGVTIPGERRAYEESDARVHSCVFGSRLGFVET